MLNLTVFLLAHGQPETSALLSVLASGRPCDGFGGFGPFGSLFGLRVPRVRITVRRQGLRLGSDMFSIFCYIFSCCAYLTKLSLCLALAGAGRTGTDAARLKCTRVLDPFGGWCRAVRFCEFWCLGHFVASKCCRATFWHFWRERP